MELLKELYVKKQRHTKNKNFAVSDEDFEKIKQNAKKYADGNISCWIRYSAINYKPTKSEISVVKDEK